MNLECFVEDLFLGGQWSIILGYRRLSVKSLLVSMSGLAEYKRNHFQDYKRIENNGSIVSHLQDNYYRRYEIND